jgi:hypothetical protein
MFVRMEEQKKEVQRFSRIQGEAKYWRLFFHQTSEPYVHKIHVELSSVFKYSQHTSQHLLLLRCVPVSFLQNVEDPPTVSQCHMLEDLNLQQHHYEKLKSIKCTEICR